MVANCGNSQAPFTERIIDDAAPQDVWMKAMGDINGDGMRDILVGGQAGGGLVAYLAPTWKKQIIDSKLSVSTNAEICDLNHDGAVDIVTIVHHAIVWLSGPDWKLHMIDSLIAHDVEVYDLNGDGLLDLAVRNQGAFGGDGGHTLYFYYQQPNGNWTRYQQEIADGEGLKMADINGDGKMDLVTNSYWFENKGGMEYWPEHKFTDTWTWPNAFVEVADMNKDGRPDILHSPAELFGNYYRISWFEAPANPYALWKEHVVIDSVETVIHSIRAADFDADGNMDIMIAEMQQGKDPDEVAVLYNHGDDHWTKQVISTQGSHSMCVYDFDRDGDVDAIGANFEEHILKMWVNGTVH